MNIICIEDNPANMLLLERVTRSTGDTLFTFPDADGALKSELIWSADLFFVNGHLAGHRNGYDLASALRRQGIDAPVIYISPDEVPEYRAPNRPGSGHCRLIRPLSVPEIVEVLNDFRPY